MAFQIDQIFEKIINMVPEIRQHWPFFVPIVMCIFFPILNNATKSVASSTRDRLFKAYFIVFGCAMIASYGVFFYSSSKTPDGKFVVEAYIPDINDAYRVDYTDGATYGRMHPHPIVFRDPRRRLYDEHFVIVESKALIPGTSYILKYLEIGPDGAPLGEERNLHFTYDGDNGPIRLTICPNKDRLELKRACQTALIPSPERWSFSLISRAFAQTVDGGSSYSDGLSEMEDIRDSELAASRRAASLKIMLTSKVLDDVINQSYISNMQTLLILSRHSDQEVSYLAERVILTTKFVDTLTQKLPQILARKDLAETRDMLEVLKATTPEQLSAIFEKAGRIVGPERFTGIPGLGDLALIPTKTPKGDAYYLRVTAEKNNKAVMACIQKNEVDLVTAPTADHHTGYRYERRISDTVKLRRRLLQCGAKVDYVIGY